MKDEKRLGQIIEFADDEKDNIIKWRREIHMHPELGFQEHRTSRFICDRLEEMGISFQAGIGKTGIVAKIGEEDAPAVGIRAELDALPIQEENSLDETPYRSQNDGVMHACGHDAHMAMLLGAAKIFKKLKNLPRGQIRLLFQPSEERADEENVHGAERMVQGGALENLDGVIAIHINSTMPKGKVWILPGYALAGGEYWEAKITGRGGHDSLVHQTIDPIYISAQVINAIYGVRARRLDPMKFGSISVGSIHGGQAGNVVPDEVKLSGTIRSLEPETRNIISKEIQKAFEVARVLGADYDFNVKHGVISLYNNPSISEIFKKVAVDLLGEKALYDHGPLMGVDDFAYMAREVPATMAMLGAQIGSQVRPLHSARFEVDESVLPLGSSLLVETACRLLSSQKS